MKTEPPFERELTVLHVDDYSAITELAKTYLERINPNFTILQASDGTTALRLLEAETIDCIVSDYDMPEMDGITLLEKVRGHNNETPFILYTGKGSEEIASEAISAGVSEYMQKSTGYDHYQLLAQRIQTQIEKYRSEEHNNQTHEALDAIDQGISILDDDGIFLFVNSNFATLLGYETRELIGERWTILYDPSDIETVQAEAIDNAVSTGSWDGQTRETMKDGGEIMLDHKILYTSGGLLVCIIDNPTPVSGTEPTVRQHV